MFTIILKLVYNGVLLYSVFVRGVRRGCNCGRWMEIPRASRWYLCTLCTFDIYFHFRFSIILYIVACEVMGNTRKSRKEYFCCELDFLKEQGSKDGYFDLSQLNIDLLTTRQSWPADDNVSIPENTVYNYSLSVKVWVELAKDNGKLCLPK